jgi:hypothetical protein
MKKVMNIHEGSSPASSFLLRVCGVWLVGLGSYFSFWRPPLLSEDLRYIGVDEDQLRVAAPGLNRWLRRVFTVTGGFIAGAGVLAVLAVRPASSRQGRWTWTALAVAGVSTVGTMTLTNFQLRSDFRWLLLIPSLLWTAGLAAGFPHRGAASREASAGSWPDLAPSQR